MRRLPPWVVFFLVVLSAVMLGVGWYERAHAGYVPVVLGVLWALFTLGAIRGMVAAEDR